MRPVEPVHLREALRGFEGRWVAIRGDEVVDADTRMEQLLLRLRERERQDVQNVTIIRVPPEGEAELVGLG